MTTEPDPHAVARDFAAPINAAVDSAYRRWEATPNRDAYVRMEMLRAAVDAATRVRDEAWRSAVELVERTEPESSNPSFQRAMEAYRTALVAGLRLADRLTRPANAPARLPAAGSAVPAEGSGHPQPATTAAGRLREIASDPQRCREWLRSHGLGDAGPGAVLLAAAADLAEGDTDV